MCGGKTETDIQYGFELIIKFHEQKGNIIVQDILFPHGTMQLIFLHVDVPFVTKQEISCSVPFLEINRTAFRHLNCCHSPHSLRQLCSPKHPQFLGKGIDLMLSFACEPSLH